MLQATLTKTKRLLDLKYMSFINPLSEQSAAVTNMLLSNYYFSKIHWCDISIPHNYAFKSLQIIRKTSFRYAKRILRLAIWMKRSSSVGEDCMKLKDPKINVVDLFEIEPLGITNDWNEVFKQQLKNIIYF